MAASFSLRRLSQKELSTVLLCMTHIDRLSYSLCSKTCKTSITELNLNASGVRVQVSHNCRIYLDFYDVGILIISTRPQTNRNAVLNLDAQQALIVESVYQNVSCLWNYNGLSCNEWLAHCMEIYHIELINKIMLSSGNYIFDQVRKVLEQQQIKIISITSVVSAELAHGILSLHLQCKEVSISVDNFGRTNLFGSMENLRKAMIQNIDNVCFRANPLPFALPLTLDDVLLTNALQLSLVVAKLTGKDLNRFLKMWIRSPNRRLKTLKAGIPNQPDLNENRIMQGIRYTAIAREELEGKMRTHNYDLGDFEAMVNGGVNIRSRDGREATVSFIAGNHASHVQFFVWN